MGKLHTSKQLREAVQSEGREKITYWNLAADIPGVPVPWFQHHALFSRKQFVSQIKKADEQDVQFVGMGTAVAQTIYAGRKPDFMRIYVKVAEWRKQQRKLEIECNRFNRRMEGMELSDEQKFYGRRVSPTFKGFCEAHGYQYQEGKVLTRIERQIGGNRIPPQLATMNDLRSAHELGHPFKGFRIVGIEPILNINSVPPGGLAWSIVSMDQPKTVMRRLRPSPLASFRLHPRSQLCDLADRSGSTGE